MGTQVLDGEGPFRVAGHEKVRAARSEFEKAKVAEQLAETTYRRVRALADEGVVARQKLDEAYTAWQVAVTNGKGGWGVGVGCVSAV